MQSLASAAYDMTANGMNGDFKERISTNYDQNVASSQVFIKALKHIKNTILTAFRKKQILDITVPIKDIQWVFAVPSFWSDRAKHKLHGWALRAGLIDKTIHNHLTFVGQSECASISCQYEDINDTQNGFISGERYITVHDSGGM